MIGLGATGSRAAAAYRSLGVAAVLPREQLGSDARDVKTRRASPLGARAPERLVAAGVCVRGAREDEEQVGDAVEVDTRERVDVRLERGELRTAGDRACDVQARRRIRAARQDEALQLGQRRVVLVAELLRASRSSAASCAAARRGRRTAPRGRRRRRRAGSARERGSRAAARAGRPRDDADVRVELVDDAVGADTRVELRRARAVAEARLARVAAARVDLREPDRLVALRAAR